MYKQLLALAFVYPHYYKSNTEMVRSNQAAQPPAVSFWSLLLWRIIR